MNFPFPITHFETKDAWLEARRAGITATDVAKVLGFSPFGGPLTVYLDKKGLSDPRPTSQRMRMGKRLEAPILEEYQEVTGHPSTLISGEALVQGECCPLVLSSLDAHWQDWGSLVEIKNLHSAMASKYGEEGTDRVDMPYLLQAHWEMLATGLERVDLAVLFGGQELKVFTITKDAELQGIMLERASRFWADHILADVPPAPDASDEAREYLAKRYAKPTGKLAEPTEEILALAEALRSAQVDLAAAEGREKEARIKLMGLLGEFDGVQTPIGKVAWVRPKPTAKLNHEALADLLWPHVPEQVREEAKRAATATRQGSAYLKPTWNKE